MANIDRLMPFVMPLIRGLVKVTQQARRSQFDALPIASDRVLFLGDSITEQGMWDEWFPELLTLNRGVGGETVAQVMARLETSIIAPRAISLLIGTNDLGGLGKSRRVETIAPQMQELITAIRKRAPNAPLIINSVIPRSAYFADRIVDLNTHYRHIAAEADATYVDIWSAMADAKGVIRPELTGDGIHLNGAGYKVWTDLLRPLLKDYA